MSHRSTVSVLVPLLVLLSPFAVPASAQEGSSPEQDTQDTSAPAPEAATSEDDGWQDLESFGEEITIEVQEVTVWVTDEDGNPVTGLTKDDFQLREDGDPVDITNFAAYEGSTAPATGGGDRPREGVAPETRIEVEEERAQLQEVPADNRLHLTVLIDNWNIRPADRARVFQDLREFLAEELEAGDRVAVAVNDRSLQLVQRFTEDPADIVRVLARVEEMAPQGIQNETERRSTLREMERKMRRAIEEAQRTGNPDPCGAAIGELSATAQGYASFVQGRVQGSASALATLSQILSGVPGRKVVLYVGNGLAQTAGLMMFEYAGELCPHHRSQLAGFQQEWNLSWLYEEVAARANTAGVTLYTLDAQPPTTDLGLESAGGGSGFRPTETSQGGSGQGVGQGGVGGGGGRSGPGMTSTPRFRPSNQAMRLEDQDEESSLVLMAQQTGGRSFLNAGDFRGDFRRLAADMRNYYSLGFTPSDAGVGRLHRLEVKLADGEDYRVRHRLRYRKKPVGERMAEKVRGVAQFGTGTNPLDARIEIGESFAAGEGSFRIPVRIWVPLERVTLLDLEGEGEGLRGRLRLLMATTDAGGSLQPVRQKVVPLEVGAREGAESPSGEHLVEVELTLPAGDHHVALGVRDDLGGETSYLRERFRVPTPAVQARSE